MWKYRQLFYFICARNYKAIEQLIYKISVVFLEFISKFSSRIEMPFIPIDNQDVLFRKMTLLERLASRLTSMNRKIIYPILFFNHSNRHCDSPSGLLTRTTSWTKKRITIHDYEASEVLCLTRGSYIRAIPMIFWSACKKKSGTIKTRSTTYGRKYGRKRMYGREWYEWEHRKRKCNRVFLFPATRRHPSLP